ncbi:hypothetical protein COCC4DRAFT_127210 [Bipolaris maydis ATCC 48331]|uniref:Uncharacterized protein n=2 Tax=Cochliobolus heterostrophus TaxID=5016 RepID=M2U9Q2_COCH5|nr:uncharacterized protein COCC4DRAFT_127210 [Bipolaris maydis ATCC 48331]EMD90461.1 hypothetical protein COCHEDRAFT_1031770 [Bipolaris maydis C5]ENI09326.1 hypothetical protein COCC4DRAFT_127210 [Bipolaris maydis ATCC 48331]KAJ6206368.1 hypothetical protein PSV09DRAFT_1031770 [Bipolaris maydis]
MGVTQGFGGFPAGASALPARAAGQTPRAVQWHGHGRGRLLSAPVGACHADSYGRGQVRPLTRVSPCVRTRRGPADVGLCLCLSDAERVQQRDGAAWRSGAAGGWVSRQAGRPMRSVECCVYVRSAQQRAGASITYPSSASRLWWPPSSQHCGGASACAGETGESSAKSGGGAGASSALGPERHGSPAREQQPCSALLHHGVD